MQQVPVFVVDLPQYQTDKEPDAQAVGKTVDDEIKKHFLGQSVIVRGVASSEHAGKSIDELIGLIQKTGTDRYDPKRTGDRYENIEGKHIDLFGVPAVITSESEVFHVIAWGFYHSAIAVHGYPVRIDVVSIYDASQMEQVLHQYEGREDIKDDGFAFKNPSDKQAALRAIIKIV
jgi:hypothetical protein